MLKCRQFQWAKPPWPGALPLNPTGSIAPDPRYRLALRARHERPTPALLFGQIEHWAWVKAWFENKRRPRTEPRGTPVERGIKGVLQVYVHSSSAEFTNLNGCYFYFLGARAGRGRCPPCSEVGGAFALAAPILNAYDSNPIFHTLSTFPILPTIDFYIWCSNSNPNRQIVVLIILYIYL